MSGYTQSDEYACNLKGVGLCALDQWNHFNVLCQTSSRSREKDDCLISMRAYACILKVITGFNINGQHAKVVASISSI